MRLTLPLGIILLSAIGALGQTPSLRDGAVYVMTNQTANAVMAFARDTNTGKLTLVDTELTGGAGNPISANAEPSTNSSARISAVIVDPDDPNVVYAVNTGSNDISVLAVEPDGLRLVQRISSGGTRPISLTMHRRRLYVLNEGDTPNINGFSVTSGGTLQMIDGSVRYMTDVIPSQPVQVGFNNDGTMLVVSEKNGNRLVLFYVDTNGVAGPPTAMPSNGLSPGGFAFGPGGDLFVAESFNDLPEGGAVSSYRKSKGMPLMLLSSGVPMFQTGTGWLTVTRDGKHVFVSNRISGTISSSAVDRNGRLTMLRSVAADTGEGSMPADIALSADDKFLYVRENGSRTISGWLVHPDRSISPIGEFGVIPSGAQGIAVR